MLSARQIEAFRAVMMTGRVTAAADILRISQPAVSRLIVDLETTLGLKLFDRDQQRLSPTEHAHALLKSVDRYFVGLDQIRDAAMTLRYQSNDAFRVAALPSLANKFIPAFLGGFLERNSETFLQLTCALSNEIVSGVVSGTFDLGIGTLPLDHPKLTVENLPLARVVVVLPPNHRLAGKEQLHATDLVDENYIALAETTTTGFAVGRVFRNADIRRKIRVETQIAYTACAMVAAGIGITIVDPFTASEFERQGLVTRPFLPTVNTEITIVHANDRQLPRIAKRFKDELKNYIVQFLASTQGADGGQVSLLRKRRTVR